MSHAKIVDAVRRALEGVFGPGLKVDLTEVVVDYPESGSVILACSVDGGTNSPEKVIAKHPRKPDGHLFHEWNCLEFLSSIDSLSGTAPAFLGGDLDTQTLVMSDLLIPEEHCLGRILDGRDVAHAEAALHEFCRGLARLHGSTLGREEEYRILCRERSPGEVSRHRVHQIPAALTELADRLALVGVSSSEGLSRELEGAVEDLGNPEPFRMLGHGDSTPTNAYYRGGAVTFFDFESAGYRHAFLDGCFPVIRYLHSVWARFLPWTLQRDLMTAYREELGEWCPPVMDDAVFSRSLMSSSAGWLAGLCAMLPGALEEDKRWGRCTHRQRIVAGLDHFVHLAGEHPGFVALGSAAEQAAGKLRKLWPEEDCTLPAYTAFGGPDPR